MSTTNQDKTRISPQKIADAGYIIEEYEAKMLKNPSKAMGIVVTRALKQAEDFIDETAQKVSPQQIQLNKDINNIQNAASGAIQDFYKNSDSAKRSFTLESEDGTTFTFKNTIAALASQENTPEQKAATLLRDCLPCDTRLTSLLMYNPLEEILKSLMNFASELKKICLELKNAILNPSPLVPNFCDLLNALNFTCVPDLNALIIMLKRYALIKLKPDVPKMPTWRAILGALISPILGIVVNIVTTWSKLVLGPVECVLNELRKQIKKLDLSAAGIKNPVTEAIKKVEEFLSDAQKETQAWVKKMLDKFNSTLNMFLKGLTKGAKLTLTASKIFSMISILASLLKVFSFDINSCGKRITEPEQAARQAADDLKKSNPARHYTNGDLDTIDTFVPANNLTEEERKSLDLPALIEVKTAVKRRTADGSVVDAADRSVTAEGIDSTLKKTEDIQVTRKFVRGVSLSFSNCPELASKSFLPVDNLINEFGG